MGDVGGRSRGRCFLFLFISLCRPGHDRRVSLPFSNHLQSRCLASSVDRGACKVPSHRMEFFLFDKSRAAIR